MQPTPGLVPGKIPWTEEPGGLWSIGSQRVGHDGSNFTHTHTRTHFVLTRTMDTLYDINMEHNMEDDT